MENDGMMAVGELAEKMAVSVRTLQYYDREGLLKPSFKSAGGRRLYTKKDMINLHQILSMKYLGFSLDQIKNNLISIDTPLQILQILKEQKETVKRQIESLSNVLNAIETLQNEASQMEEVDFNKYADIVGLLRQKNDGYWVVKYFDHKFMSHVKEKYMFQPEKGLSLFTEWKNMCDETVLLKAKGEDPGGERGQSLAERWWSMVMEATGGDMSLLPELIKFNETKHSWSKELQEKQTIADEFIGKALEIYFSKMGIQFPEMEVNDEFGNSGK